MYARSDKPRGSGPGIQARNSGQGFRPGIQARDSGQGFRSGIQAQGFRPRASVSPPASLERVVVVFDFGDHFPQCQQSALEDYVEVGVMLEFNNS